MNFLIGLGLIVSTLSFDQPTHDIHRPRSEFWRPLGSFFLPGLGQWAEGQSAYAGVYTGVAVAGTALVISGGHSNFEGFADRSSEARRALIGQAFYSGAGGVSAYNDFRTAVTTHRSLGEYAFLPADKVETPGQLALAPFRMDYLLRWTTLLPLAILGAGVAVYGSKSSDGFKNIRMSDSPVIGSISYNAGVGEEAAFRGWLLPMFHQKMGQRFWASNLSQAGVFAALHIQKDNYIPWPQLLLGSYLGWLAQYRDWEISEGIFIHAWWDVLALTALFAATGDIDEIRTPTLQIPF